MTHLFDIHKFMHLSMNLYDQYRSSDLVLALYWSMSFVRLASKTNLPLPNFPTNMTSFSAKVEFYFSGIYT